MPDLMNQNVVESVAKTVQTRSIPEGNHTPRLLSIVRTQTTTMDKAKTWLKEHGQILESDI